MESFQRTVEQIIDPLLRSGTDADTRAFLLAQLSAEDPDVTDLVNALASLSQAMESVALSLAALENGTSAFVKALESLAELRAPLERVASLLGQHGGGSTTVGRVAECIFGLWIEAYHPSFARVLALLTLAERAKSGDTPLDWWKIRAANLSPLLQDPLGHLEGAWLRDPTQFNTVLLPLVAEQLRSLDISAVAGAELPQISQPAVVPDIPTNALAVWFDLDSTEEDEQVDEPVLVEYTWDPNATDSLVAAPTDSIDIEPDDSRLGLVLTADPQDSGLSLSIEPFGVVARTFRSGEWFLEAEFAADTALTIDGDGPRADTAARASARLARAEDAGPIVLGSTDGTHVGCEAVSATARAEVDEDGAASARLEFEIRGGSLVVVADDGDSFVASILPPAGIRASFDLAVRVSEEGLHFSGSVGLDLTIPLDVDLSLITLTALTLHVGVGESGADILLSAGLSGALRLLIAEASIEGIGLRAKIRFPAEADGNLGPVDLRLGFKPPTGLGLRLGTDVCGGGGFLDFDEESGQYAGVLQLDLAGLADVTAIALLDTRLPDGSDGWSFLGLLFASFDPGIQIGFGFTLLGVGGLFAFNRELDSAALLATYAAGRLPNLMFPADPVAEAPTLIADLRAIFPTSPGRFVIGPMVKMGFGTPTVVEAELGILVSLPDPVVIVLLGELGVYLPARLGPLMELHVDVLGYVDAGRKVLFFGGRLRDSKVLAWTLTGSLALRMTWSDGTDFAFSAGGFHPDYTPPADFPPMDRMGVSCGLGDHARLEQLQYFAITPNTLQLGASIELVAELSGFGVRAWAGFDALLVFDPFSFQADFAAGVEVRWGGSVLASLTVDGHLTGPAPLHLWGRVRISLFLWDISIPIDLCFGEADPAELVDGATPREALESALSDATYWSTARPAGPRRIALRVLEPEEDAPPVFDPAGELQFRQPVLPLGRPIDRFAQRDLAAEVRFDPVPPADATITMLDAPFAPAQFRQMSDTERLSLPRPFEDMHAGFSYASDGVEEGTARTASWDWEDRAVDEDEEALAATSAGASRKRREIGRVRRSPRFDFAGLAGKGIR